MNSFDTSVQCEEVYGYGGIEAVPENMPANELETIASTLCPSKLARSTDPSTSHIAARQIKQRTIQKLYRAILELCYGEAGSTDHDLVLALGYAMDTDFERGIASPSGIRTRRSELVELGCIYAAGKVLIRQPHKVPRLHTTWETTDLGYKVMKLLKANPEMDIHTAIKNETLI